MSRMTQFGLATIFAIGLPLLTSTPVKAQTQGGTIALTPAVTAKDRDYGATGHATLADVTYDTTRYEGEFPYQYAYDVYTGYLTVTCEGLTPGATYRVGPTRVFETMVKYKGHVYYADTYSFVTASGTGTLELATQATFIGCAYQWIDVPWLHPDWPGYWEESCFGYGLFVDRNQGSKYSRVLTGYFP